MNDQINGLSSWIVTDKHGDFYTDGKLQTCYYKLIECHLSRHDWWNILE